MCQVTNILIVALSLAILATGTASAQGRRDDYARAQQFLSDEVKKLAFDGHVDPSWIRKTNRFWYRKEGPFGKQFVLVDAASLTSGPAFDHERLAASLSS